MPNQSPLHFVKRWRRYQDRPENWPSVPKNTRGVYVLYRSRPSGRFDVCYIGVSGLGPNGTGGIRRRLKRHVKKRRGGRIFHSLRSTTTSHVRRFASLKPCVLGIFVTISAYNSPTSKPDLESFTSCKRLVFGMTNRLPKALRRGGGSISRGKTVVRITWESCPRYHF